MLAHVLIRIFSILFPVFGIAAIGYAYGRYRPLDMTVANRLNMDLFLPALVISALANKEVDLAAYGALALGGLVVTLGSGLMALPAARRLNADPKTFVPPMMFNNAGNMGIPVAVLAFGAAALPGAVVLWVLQTALHFSLGIYILDRRTRFYHLLRMPLILATLIGLSLSIGGWTLPAVVSTLLKMLGDVGIPLMLFSLGVRLNEVSLKEWRIGVWGALLRPLSGLLIVWLIMSWLALTPMQQSMLWIFAALPPAVINYLLAEKYAQEPEKVASIIVLGHLASLVIMPLALALALR